MKALISSKNAFTRSSHKTSSEPIFKEENSEKVKYDSK